MALMSKKSSHQEQPHRIGRRPLDALLEELRTGDVAVRRRAAGGLADWPEAVEALCAWLPEEPDGVTRERIFSALQLMDGEAVVVGLIPLLRVDDPSLRNGAVDVLGVHAEALAPHVDDLLSDPDPDVRIMTLEIMAVLKDPRVIQWLVGVIRTDDHVNVLAVAVDHIARCGDRSAVTPLRALRRRRGDVQYLKFAIGQALSAVQER